MRSPRPLLGTVGVVGRALGWASGAVARVRRARPLHPTGVVLHGRLVRTGTAHSGIAWLDAASADDVVVRLSRGGGLPTWLPDVDGLAVRVREGERVTDVLLSTTGTAPLDRHVMHVRRLAGRTAYTSLLPYRSARGPVLLAAIPDPPRRLPADPAARGLELAVEPLRLRLAWASPTGPWRTFGHLEVYGQVAVDPEAPIRFDPLRTPQGLATYPWVAAVRDPAYDAARRAVGPDDPATGARRQPSTAGGAR